MSDEKIKYLRVTTKQLVGELLFYGRKADEDLSRQDVVDLFTSGEVDDEMIAGWFFDELKKRTP